MNPLKLIQFKYAMVVMTRAHIEFTKIRKGQPLPESDNTIVRLVETFDKGSTWYPAMNPHNALMSIPHFVMRIGWQGRFPPPHGPYLEGGQLDELVLK